MYSAWDDTELPVPGCPIRKSPDQRLLDSSPRPIAASHVLHRLLAPRHPPCALSSLTSIRRHYQVRLHKPDTHMQLSKTRKNFSFRSANRRVELIGIEPTTSALQGRRSPN